MSDVVAFDLRAAGPSATGAGRYLLSIVRAVAEHRPDLRIRAYVRDEVPDLPDGTVVVSIRSRGPLWHLRVWWDLRRRPVRAWCSTSLMIPALSRTHCLPVILDVISFIYPQYHTWRTKLAERLLMRRAIGRHPLIAGSETTRLDVERLFGPVRAVVVHPWVSAPEPIAEGPELLSRFGIDRPYALYVGTVEPRKNVLTAVRAVGELRTRGRDLRLLVVGGRGWVDGATRAELAEAEHEGLIAWPGYLPDADRDALFASAACLALPSVYEGFGMPLLEGLRRGVPCICSTAPAFREVAGDAALFVDPFAVTAWADALERVLSEPSLADSLAQRGSARAELFTAAATAAQFGRALEQLG